MGRGPRARPQGARPVTSGPSPYSPSREFRFTSEVPIWLDYHGKHVTMDQVVSGLSGPHPAVALGGQGAGNTGRCQPLEAPGGWTSPWAPGCITPAPLPSPGHFRRPPHRPGPAQLLRAEAKAALLPAWVSLQASHRALPLFLTRALAKTSPFWHLSFVLCEMGSVNPSYRAGWSCGACWGALGPSGPVTPQ